MGNYPDHPDPSVAALRDGLLELFKARRFDQAADLALTLTEPITRYSPIDTIADEISRRRPEDALTLYESALQSARVVASYATSGAEGMMYMTDVHRLEKKVADVQKRLAEPPSR